MKPFPICGTLFSMIFSCARFFFLVLVAFGASGEGRGRASGMSPQKARPSALEKKHAEDVPGGARRTSAFPFETGAGAPFGRFSAVGLLVQIEVDAGAASLARRDRPHHTRFARPRQAESSAGRGGRVLGTLSFRLRPRSDARLVSRRPVVSSARRPREGAASPEDDKTTRRRDDKKSRHSRLRAAWQKPLAR